MNAGGETVGFDEMRSILSPFAALFASINLVLPILFIDDGLGTFYLFIIGPSLFLVAGAVWLKLATTASRIRRLCHAIAFLLLFPVPVAAIATPGTTRLIAAHDAEDLITWQFRGGKYRVPDRMTAGTGLRHARWRDWGFLSVWTEAYLVFDKADALASFAFRGGDVPGVPCGVWHVLPLQKQWYVVTLYSGQTWDVCG